ncbi:MAG: response regulator, partial [Ramlibacter sp.]
MSESTQVPIALARPSHTAAAGTSLLAGATAKALAIADSDMAAAISGFDWAATPLGPAEAWPQSLKSTVRLLLGSRYPGFLLWGEQLVAIYNDAYVDVLGPRHPWALGRSFKETWGEIWDVVGPQFEAVMREGASTWADRVLLVMERKGYAEETYFTFSYSPCFDDAGDVGGVFCTCTEETGRVLGERRLQSLRALSAAVLESRNPEHACQRAAAALASNRHDLPFVLFYLQDGPVARLVASTGADDQPLLASADIALAEGAPWFLAEVAGTRQPRHVPGIDRIATVPAGPWPEPVRDALVLPLPAPTPSGPAGFLVAGLNPRRPVDAEYDDYLTLVAQQVAGAVADARSFEEEQQRARALAELDRAKTAFFSNISHELRTPLALVLGPLADLLDAGTLDERARDALALAQRNGRRLQRLVNTLLDFSRIEAGRMQARFQPVELACFTAELASFFDSAARKAGLLLQVDCPPLPQPVYVDRSMWEKIVFNLLSNAIKYTLAGSVQVRLRLQGDAVRLEVQDTGLGIPQAALPRVFDRFYRVEGAQGRSIEGTGIGLALVAELARMHGAQPQVESWLGAGSTFSLTLPFGHAHLPAAQVDHAPPEPAPVSSQSGWLEEMDAWFTPDEPMDHQVADAGSLASEPVAPWDASASPARPALRGSVLLVDDNPEMRGYLARLLAREHEVRTASDGWQALQRIAERMPDLVVSDVMMGRMDGLMLLERLRADQATAALPVILLSANAGEEARLQALAAGADDFLVKPFHARELLTRAAGTLRLAQVRREAMQREQQVRAEVQQVLESITEGFVAVDSDWRYTYINASAEGFYGRSRDSLLGVRMWDAFPDLLGSAFETAFRGAMQDRVPAKVEAPYDSLGCWFEVSIFPVASGGLSFYFRDVLQNRLLDRALRESEEQQRFLSDFGQLVQRIEDPRAVLDAAVGALALHLQVDRCVWMLVDDGAETGTVCGEFRANGMASRLGVVQLRDYNLEQLRLLRQGRTFTVVDAATDPRLPAEREQYRKVQIGAAVSAGVLRGDRLVAAIAVHQRGPRDWTDSEVQLVQAVATRCWEAFERAQVQQRQ